MRAINEEPSWTSELEAKYRVLEGDFEDFDDPDERQRAEDRDDEQAFIEQRREEFERFRAAQRAARDEGSDG